MNIFSSSTKASPSEETHGFQCRMKAFRQIVQGEWSDKRFHVGDRTDSLLVAIGPVETQSAAPVMQYECHWLFANHFIHEGVDVAGMAGKAVSVGVGVGRNLVRVAHADEVRGNQSAAGCLDLRQNVSP